MKKSVQRGIRLGMLLGVLGEGAWCAAQADATATSAATVITPVATVSGMGYELPTGTFRYGATASELFQFGYGGQQGTTYETNLSGNVAYSSRSVNHPFSAVYSGGVELANQTGYGTTFYQSLALTQSYLTRFWTMSVSDAVSYLPQSPTVGLSGIPGTGDLGLTPVAGSTGVNQSVLSYNSDRVTNTASGTVSRHLSGRTTVSGDANWSILHFFDNTSLDSRQIAADVSVSYQVDARTSVGVGANYSIFDFDAQRNASFASRSVSGQVSRQFTRTLTGSASVGPEWINSSAALGIPSRLTVMSNAALTYAKRFGTTAVSFSRGTTGGAGVLPGAIVTSASASFGRSFGRDWSGSLNVGYAKSSGLATGNAPDLALLGLPNYGSFNSTFGAAQVSRRLSGSLSAFGSYTAASQSYANFGGPGTLTHGVLNGTVQTAAIGISYYPKSLIPGLF